MKTIFYLILTILFYSCATNNVNHGTFLIESKDISFSCPKNWKRNTLHYSNNQIARISPKKITFSSNKIDYSPAYVTLNSVKNDSVTYNQLLDNLSRSGKIIKRTAKHSITLCKINANSEIYVDLTHSFIKNNTRYILRYHSQENFYKKYLADFEKIAKSFKIK